MPPVRKSKKTFLESGSSDDPCSEIYQGIFAFSEPESRLAECWDENTQFFICFLGLFERPYCPTDIETVSTGSSHCILTLRFGYIRTDTNGGYRWYKLEIGLWVRHNIFDIIEYPKISTAYRIGPVSNSANGIHLLWIIYFSIRFSDSYPGDVQDLWECDIV